MINPIVLTACFLQDQEVVDASGDAAEELQEEAPAPAKTAPPPKDDDLDLDLDDLNIDDDDLDLNAANVNLDDEDLLED